MSQTNLSSHQPLTVENLEKDTDGEEPVLGKVLLGGLLFKQSRSQTLHVQALRGYYSRGIDGGNSIN